MNSRSTPPYVLYSAENSVFPQSRLLVVKKLFTMHMIERHHSLDSLWRSLCRMEIPRILVLVCLTTEELLFFWSIRAFLTKHRIILVLPDHRPETIRRAHRLHPRFLSFTDSDFSDVLAVMSKMMMNRKTQNGNLRA